MNAFRCQNDNDLAVLEWEGIGEDKFKIISSPVYLKNDDFTNKVN